MFEVSKLGAVSTNFLLDFGTVLYDGVACFHLP